MTFRANLLNFVCTFEYENWDIIDFHKSLKFLKFENECVKLQNFKLYQGNKLSNQIDLIENLNCKYSVMLAFSGDIRFSVLFRSNKQFRVSTSIPYEMMDNDIETYIYMICDMIGELFHIDVDNSNYYILMLNGVYYIEHNIMNTVINYERIKNMELFPCILPPDYSGLIRRRKGTIKLYMHQNKKCGTISINSKSFQLMGFTKLKEIMESIEKINLICERFK